MTRWWKRLSVHNGTERRSVPSVGSYRKINLPKPRFHAVEYFERHQGRPRTIMEYRQLGRSGFNVPVLTLGTGTFGGKGRLAAGGTTDATEATRLIDICLDHGLSMFDSADIYSNGEAEEVLGAAIKGRRDKVLISTKAG